MATIRKLRGRWQAMVRRKGIAPRCKSFDKKSDAEKWARDLESEIDQTGWLADTRPAERTTLGELLARYRDEITPTKRGADAEKYRLNGILKHPICHRTLNLLSSSDVATYRDERLKVVAPGTVLKELNVMGHALEIAQREWNIALPRNPVKLVRRPQAPAGRKRRLQPGEEDRLLAACELGRTPLLRPIIILAIETGMRRGEIISMEWRHVDLAARVVHLPLTKNGEARDVPLSSRAAETLRALTETRTADEPRVFPISAHALEQAWGHLRGRVGMTDLHFHDLRHEAVSRLFEKGLGIHEVSAISGHKELRMLARYTHLRATDLVARLG